MFNSIKNSFIEISKRVENVNSVIEKLGSIVDDSMTQISIQIEGLTKTLEDLMNISDLKNIRKSLSDIVETFRTQLDPKKMQKLITDLSQSVKTIKQKA